MEIEHVKRERERESEREGEREGKEEKRERESTMASFSDIESNFVIAEPRGRFVKHLLSS